MIVIVPLGKNVSQTVEKWALLRIVPGLASMNSYNNLTEYYLVSLLLLFSLSTAIGGEFFMTHDEESHTN